MHWISICRSTCTFISTSETILCRLVENQRAKLPFKRATFVIRRQSQKGVIYVNAPLLRRGAIKKPGAYRVDEMFEKGVVAFCWIF